FGEQKTQAATAEAEHRVCFADFIDVMQQLPLLINLIQQVIHVGERARVTQSHLQLREFAEKFIHVRQEFVQRRIEQANRYGEAGHLAKDPDKIAALQRQELIERLFARTG